MRIVYCIVSLLSVCTSFVLYAACEEVKLVPTQYPSDSVTRVFNVKGVPHRTEEDENLETYNHFENTRKWHERNEYKLNLSVIVGAGLVAGVTTGVADYCGLNNFSRLVPSLLSGALCPIALCGRRHYIGNELCNNRPQVNLDDIYRPSDAYLEKQAAFFNRFGMEILHASGDKNKSGESIFDMAHKIIASDPKNAADVMKELPYIFSKKDEQYFLSGMENIAVNANNYDKISIDIRGNRPTEKYCFNSNFMYKKNIKKADAYSLVFNAYTQAGYGIYILNSETGEMVQMPNCSIEEFLEDCKNFINVVINKNKQEFNYSEDHIVRCDHLQHYGGMKEFSITVYQHTTGNAENWENIELKECKANSESFSYLNRCFIDQSGKIVFDCCQQKKIGSNIRKAR